MSPLYSVGHVQLPNRVLLLCSPCASCHRVPCSASQVVPGAHRVVGPGTHRGSGPREVHTTVRWTRLMWEKFSIVFAPYIYYKERRCWNSWILNKKEKKTYKNLRLMNIEQEKSMNTNAKSPPPPPLGSIYRERGGGCFYYFHWWGQELHSDPRYLHSSPWSYKRVPRHYNYVPSPYKNELISFLGLFYTQWGP
jgi:hypothetical protein